MIEPPVIDPSPQMASADCAICCLSKLLGIPYADVLAVIPQRKCAKRNGLSERQVIAIAKRLKFKVRARTTDKPPDEDEFGILDLYDVNNRDGHHVLHLTGGNILDPADGLIYTDLDTFLKTKEWKIQGFFWRET